MSERLRACPSRAELLLFMEEPDCETQEHVAGCAACQDALAEIREGEGYVGEYRALYDRRAASQPSVARFRARLRSEATRPSFWRKPLFRWPRAAAFAAAAAACLLLVLHSRDVWNPASVEAAELLKNAGAHPKHVRHFLVRQGGRVVARMDDHKLQIAKIDSRDPLNPTDFAHWREEQENKRDRITRGDGWVRLSTAVLGDGAIESASITVNSRDWQPFARSVHFRGEDEIEFQALPDERQPAPPPAASLASNSPVAPPSNTAPDQAGRSDELAISAWEVLHATRADVLDSAQLRRQDGGLCYELWSDGERRNTVKQALAKVPDVEECRQEGAANRPVRVLDPLSDSHTTATAFRAALLRYFGDEDHVDRYMDDVAQRYARVLAHVTALERYIRWFTPAVMDSLEPAGRRRVEMIAQDHIAEIRSKGSEYIRAISEGLNAVRAPQGVPDRRGSAPPARECGISGSPSSLAEDLRQLQRSFTRLSTGAPDIEESFERTLQARSALAQRLTELCTPTP